MRYLIAIVLSLSLVTVAQARERRPKPATLPTTKPATMPSAELQKQIDQLIQKLGDTEYRTREAASAELRRIGEPAVPQLKDASRNKDAEIAARAQYVLDEIAEAKAGPAQPANPQGPVIVQQGVRGGRVMIHVGAMRGVGQADPFDKTIEEDGRKIRIQRNASGITMTVTEKKDGKEVTAETKAKTAEELQQKNPELHKIYEKHAPQQPAAGNVQVKIIGQ